MLLVVVLALIAASSPGGRGVELLADLVAVARDTAAVCTRKTCHYSTHVCRQPV
jgi:hypothetical protein